MRYHWDFSGLVPYAVPFARGLVISALLAVGSSAFGTILGVPLAILLRRRPWISSPLAFVLDIIRAIPNLVVIFFFYYFPYREALGITPPSPFESVLVALVVAQAAYSAELLRAALEGVPRLPVEGLLAMGFSQRAVLRYAIIPSVVRQALPGHIALWIGNLKLSSLASVVGVEDVVFVAKVAMSQSFRSLEAWSVVTVTYVLMVLPVTYLVRIVERSAWIRRK